jgi:adenylate kinase
MVQSRLEEADCARGAIFDGYPRNTAQAEVLENLLEMRGASIAGAVYIAVQEDELMRRLTGRRVCRNCQATYHVVFNPPARDGHCDRCGGILYQRDDDKDEAAIRRRLELYFQDTMPVIEWYRSRGLLSDVDGQQPIQEVQRSITALLNGGAVAR